MRRPNHEAGRGSAREREQHHDEQVEPGQHGRSGADGKRRHYRRDRVLHNFRRPLSIRPCAVLHRHNRRPCRCPSADPSRLVEIRAPVLPLFGGRGDGRRVAFHRERCLHACRNVPQNITLVVQPNQLSRLLPGARRQIRARTNTPLGCQPAGERIAKLGRGDREREAGRFAALGKGRERAVHPPHSVACRQLGAGCSDEVLRTLGAEVGARLC